MANCVWYATIDSAFVLFLLISVTDLVFKRWLRVIIQRDAGHPGETGDLKRRPVACILLYVTHIIIWIYLCDATSSIRSWVSKMSRSQWDWSRGDNRELTWLRWLMWIESAMLKCLRYAHKAGRNRKTDGGTNAIGILFSDMFICLGEGWSTLPKQNLINLIRLIILSPWTMLTSRFIPSFPGPMRNGLSCWPEIRN